MNQDMEIALLSQENVSLKQRVWQLESHLRVLVSKTPNRATMTIVAESPWLTEAKRLVGK